MKVHIHPHKDGDQFLVNGKHVRQDMDDNWIAKPELNPIEEKFFGEYLKTDKMLSQPLTATYKT